MGVTIIYEALKTIDMINKKHYPDNPVYIVGGFVRNLLLGKGSPDVDLLVIGRVRELAEEAASQLEASFISLDEANQVYRLIIKEPFVQIDVAAPKGSNSKGKALREDLALRDFTINALAILLANYLRGTKRQKNVIDYHGGIEHLREKRLHPVNSRSIQDDPLRILRGIRLAGSYGLSFSKECIYQMKAARKDLTNVSGERIRDELWQIFAVANSRDYIEQMTSDFEVLPVVIPEIHQMEETEQNNFHVENVWQHSLRVLGELELILKHENWPDEVSSLLKEYLFNPVSGGRNRIPLLKVAALFHDIGKIVTQKKQETGKITFYNHQKEGVTAVSSILRRLKLGNREASTIKTIVKHHMDPLNLFQARPLTKRAKNRFFYRCGKDTLGVLILALADNAAAYKARAEVMANGAVKTAPDSLAAPEFQRFIFALLRDYSKEEKHLNQLPQLLTGKDIMEHFNIPQGREVGRLLHMVKLAQIDGEVTTKQEALNLIEEGNKY